jgi:DNA polymerase III delta prime subunit
MLRESGVCQACPVLGAFCARLIRDLLSELPALLLVGPRATGKTTTASRHAATVIRLDRPGDAVAFQADPDSALRGLEEPILLDEWQVIPEVLGAVKRAVDTDPRPGRFLLTGSVRADLDAPTWPGTGRLVRVPMFGMTIAEQRGRIRTKPLLPSLHLRFVRSWLSPTVARASTIYGRNRAATKSICWPRYLQHGSSVSRSRPALRLVRTPHNIWFGYATN